jgi:hypothetical protein
VELSLWITKWIFDCSGSVTEIIVSGVLIFYKNSLNKIEKCVFKSIGLAFFLRLYDCNFSKSVKFVFCDQILYMKSSHPAPSPPLPVCLSVSLSLSVVVFR